MRLASGIRARPGARVLALAAALGALVAAGQAPLGWWWLALPAFAGVLALAGRQAGVARAGWLGWAAGAGYAAAAMFWIVEPFLVDAPRYGWMAPFALLFMAAGMGLFWAAATALGAALGRPGSGRRLLALAVAFAASDLLRGYLFTGLPWVLLGHVWIGTPLMQLAALAGPVGLTLLFALPAAGLARALSPAAGGGARFARTGSGAMAVAVLAAGWSWGAARLAEPAPAPDRQLTVRLVQPNATQSQKWHPEHLREFFYRQLDLTAAAAPGTARPDLIVWPETSVPFLLNDPGPGLAMIAEAAGGVPVALGIQRAEDARYFNSLVVLGAAGEVTALYDKFHLTPFGEYIPFGDAMAKLGVTAFAAQAGNGYSAGPGAQVLDLGALGHVQPLICYEAVFPQDLRAAPSRPDWLLQVTNDGWFGALAGPQQHLAQARLRAVETGLPLARAANTGVSAMIDARGRVLTSLAMNTSGFIDAALPAALPATLYAQTGDLPIFAFIVTLLALLGALRAIAVDRARPPV